MIISLVYMIKPKSPFTNLKPHEPSFLSQPFKIIIIRLHESGERLNLFWFPNYFNIPITFGNSSIKLITYLSALAL